MRAALIISPLLSTDRDFFAQSLNLLRLCPSFLRLVRRFTEKRLSRSQPGAGVVGIEHTLEDPEATPLFRTRGFILVARRPATA